MSDSSDGFDEWVGDVHDRAREIHELLAQQTIRIFCLSLKSHGRYEREHWIHDGKTVTEWREDIRGFLHSCDMEADDGWADDGVENALRNHLRSLGYAEVDDVVADVFEGRVTNRHAGLVHDPVHEEQPDGFGHYGWENGRNDD